MRINTIFIIILSLILNSCAVYSQDKIEQKLLKKIEGQKYNENLNLNELYISEGHFVCSKSQEPINRLESTSDGINDNFLYITNNGRMFFSSLPTSKYNKRDISNKEFDIPNAVFYKKNGNYIVERKSVTHAILGLSLIHI